MGYVETKYVAEELLQERGPRGPAGGDLPAA